MKKLGFILIAIFAVVVGLLVGARNPGAVQIDLLWTQVELPLGQAILLGFSLGIISGMTILYLARILPLRLQLRKARSQITRQDSPSQRDSNGLTLPDD